MDLGASLVNMLYFTWRIIYSFHYNNRIPLYICFSEVVKPGHEMTFLSLVNLNDENRTYFTTCDGTYSKIEISNYFTSSDISYIIFFHGVIHDSVKIPYLILCSNFNLAFLRPDNQKYYLYTSTIQDLNKFRSLSNAFTRFFSMINPADLRN
jgi:hypothetical protein